MSEKKITFSAAQTKALNLKKQNMLISAGAGSGKTAVLVERLIRIVTTQNVDLDEVLVLTFTNAGALEFKKRIKESLLLSEKHAHKVFALDDADITTYDAYALKIIKKYGYLKGISPSVTNLSGNIETIFIRRYFNEYMASLYENPSPIFDAFAKRFLTLNDENLYTLFTSFWRNAELKLDPLHFAETYLETYYNEKTFEEHYAEFNRLVVTTLRKLASAMKKLSDERYIKLYEPFLAAYGDVLTFEHLLETKVLLKKMRRPINNRIDFPEDEEYFQVINDGFLELKKYVDNCVSKATMYENFMEDKDYVSLILDIYAAVYQKVRAEKDKLNAYTFSDLAHFALELVSLPEVANELKNQYAYILIDEYQDTSDLQEALISYISNDNVYMVGDIKQSIYGFRNANSDIFRAKFSAFAANEGGELVVLNDNYRSRPEILSTINSLLSKIMSEKYGGADYQKDHIIGYGNKKYDEHYALNQKVGLEVYNYDDKLRRNPHLDNEDENVISKHRPSLEQQEYEADIVIENIKAKLKHGFEVYDDKKKVMRKAEYRDFTILVEVSTNFEKIKQRFVRAGIPLFIDRPEITEDDKVHIVFKNMLKIIYAYHHEDNPDHFEFRFSAASFLRGFVCNYTDQALYDLFNPKDKNLNMDPVLAKLRLLGQKSRKLPLTSIVNEAIDTFNMYDALYKLGNIIQNTFKLSAEKDEIKRLEELGLSFNEIIEYFAEVELNKLKVSVERPKTSDNTVNLMTMHNAKGLEFPIVYFIGLTRRFETNLSKTHFAVDDKYGFIMPLPGLIPSFLEVLKNEYNRVKNLSEYTRLLYVALTRAREVMVTVHPLLSDEKEVAPGSENSFAELLVRDEKYCKEIILTKPSDDNDFAATKYSSYQGSRKIVLKKQPVEFQVTVKPFTGITPLEASESLLQRGTLLHRYIELYDFETKKLDYIPSLEDRHHLKTLLELPLFVGAHQDNVYREYEFIDEESEKTYIIDFFIVMARKIVLLDFKLYNIEEESYVSQIQNYARHLERVFNKPVEAHLVSILTFKSKEVKTIE